MSLTAVVTSFAIILPAELPDKTIVACLILSSRYRPQPVFAGAAAAFGAQVVLAVAAGGVLSLLPHRVITAAAAAAFLAGAVLLWRHHEDRAEDDLPEGRSGTWPVVWTAFAVVFLAEFGDLTQLMTISLAARFHDPLGVGTGAVLGLWSAAALAVIVGWRLLKLIPVVWLTRGAAVIMVILAVTSAATAAGVHIPGL